FPSSRQRRSGRLDVRDTVPVDIDPGGAHLGKPSGKAGVKAVLLKPYEYKSSYLTSGLTSFLLGGVSRIAIMAALGATGAPVIAGAVLAGVGAGAVTSYYKN